MCKVMRKAELSKQRIAWGCRAKRVDQQGVWQGYLIPDGGKLLRHKLSFKREDSQKEPHKQGCGQGRVP